MVDIARLVATINKVTDIKIDTFDYSEYNALCKQMFEWYKGKGPASYDVYYDTNGVKKVQLNKSHLGMAKRVCEDNTSLTFNDNVVINIDNQKVKKYLLGKEEVNGFLGQSFFNETTKLVELVFALGTGAIELGVENLEIKNGEIISFKDKTKLKLYYHNVFDIVPLSWDENKNITSVAFIKEKTKIINKKSVNVIYVTIHYLLNNEYIIINKTFTDSKTNLPLFSSFFNPDNKLYSVINNEDGVIESFNTHSSVPMFSILKTNIVNNYNIYSPLGVSVYANAVDALMSADDAFSLFRNEMNTSNKKIMMDYSLLPSDPKTGCKIMKENDLPNMFYVGANENKSTGDVTVPFTEFNPTIRVDSISKAIQLSLNLISALCGLGENYYKFDNGSIKTATEVLSENSSCYRNIKKNTIAIKQFLIDLFKSIVHYSNLFLDAGLNENTNYSIEFDTSIIEDKATSRKNDLEEVKVGTMTIEEFREKWYGVPRRSEDDSFMKDNDNE